MNDYSIGKAGAQQVIHRQLVVAINNTVMGSTRSCYLSESSIKSLTLQLPSRFWALLVMCSMKAESL